MPNVRHISKEITNRGVLATGEHDQNKTLGERGEIKVEIKV